MLGAAADEGPADQREADIEKHQQDTERHERRHLIPCASPNSVAIHAAMDVPG